MFGPVRTLILAAALYLPLAFFVWFAFAQAMVAPVVFLAKKVLFTWMPDVFVGLEQKRYFLDWVINLPLDAEQLKEAGGQAAGLVVTTNPMIYGYGLPVVVGLVMATPMRIRKRFMQVAIAAVVIWLVQTNGVVWEAIKYVMLEAGPAGTAAISQHGLSPNVVAFCYQLSYLIFSSLAPVLLWVVMNRNFIEQLLKAHTFEQLEDSNDAN
jgi:hypothetical protein